MQEATEDPLRRASVVGNQEQKGFADVKSTAYWVILCGLALPTAALAQDRGSAEDQLSCTPDVYRLCGQNIPDEDAIVACLQAHKSQLSGACKAVFSHPQPPKQPDANQEDE